MTTDTRYPLIRDIAVGQRLPTLEHSVTATTVVLGAMASRDWRPMHHDRDFAINRNGVQDIFLNTPTQAAWLERYITDWTGPKGRLLSMAFKMKTSVFPGDLMRITGVVEKVAEGDVVEGDVAEGVVEGRFKGTEVEETATTGCGRVTLVLSIHVGERLATRCEAVVAVPASEADNPWM